MIEGGGVPVWLAFAAGFVSFASACVLPIVPAFGLLVAGGTGVGSPESVGRRRVTAAAQISGFFLLGFALFFVLAGATASWIGTAVRDGLPLIESAGALSVVLLGVMLLAPLIARRTFTSGDWRPIFVGVTAVVAGAGFAAAWSPCIGPVLAGILFYAAFPETVVEGVALLSIYSAGLAVPFAMIGVGVGWLLGRLREERLRGGVNAVLGVALLMCGVLLITGHFASVTAYLSGFGPMFEIGL